MQILRTWGRRSEFGYSGSVATGTEIHYGKDSHRLISRDQYAALLARFQGRKVDIGASRGHPPAGSLGAWLQQNVTRSAIATYVGPILLHEGYAERGVERSQIVFKPGRVLAEEEKLFEATDP
jgi:hypothetical protein